MHGERIVRVCWIILVVCLAFAASAGAAERCVLAEEFSQSFCLECPTAEAALDSLVKHDFGPGELAIISSYPEFFPPGTSESWARGRYYGVEDMPVVWFDGVDEKQGAAEGIDSLRAIYRDMVLARRAVPSPLTVDLTVEFGAKADTGTAHVRVAAVDPIAFQGLRLRLAVIESEVFLPYGGRTVHHVMRDYVPDTLGLSLTMTQGDTDHSEQFIIDPAWIPENCDIVVFVQDDTTREVLQAVQAPVVAEALDPAMVEGLRAHLSGDDLLLAWSPVTEDAQGGPLTVDHYLVYRDTLAFREPGSDPFQTTADTFFLDDTGPVGDTGEHFFYWVTAVAGDKESADSDGVGEIDKELPAGK